MAVLLAALLALAALPRLVALQTLPDFFGPGDPATYHAMAEGVLERGVPRIDFIWHYLSRPERIPHVEDYYEPVFAWLLAVPVAIGGGDEGAGRWLAFVCGLLTVALVAWMARGFGMRAALLAGAIVAIEPWSVYYSAVVMKETAVAAVVLVFLAAARRLLAPEHAAWRAGLALGALAVAASLIQYELMPILFVTAVVPVLLHRRAALAGVIAGYALAALALLGVTQAALGVPVSAKLGFFFGSVLTTPEPMVRASGSLLERLLPVRYAADQIAAVGSPLLLALAAIGARFGGVARVEVTTAAAFLAAFLWVHAVPGDLWARDFIPLVAVAAPWAGAALSGAGGWWRRPWALPLAVAALVLTVAEPVSWRLVRIAGLEPAHGVFTWTTAASLLIAATVAAAMALFGRVTAVRAPALTAGALIAGLLAAQWLSLPLPAIPGNPQFPHYAERRAHLTAVGAEVRTLIDSGPLMCREPWQLERDTGLDCVLLPLPATARAIETVRARYGVQYLLVGPLEAPAQDRPEVGDHVLQALGLEGGIPVADHRLYRLADPDASPRAP